MLFSGYLRLVPDFHWPLGLFPTIIRERSVNICEPHLDEADAREAMLRDESGRMGEVARCNFRTGAKRQESGGVLPGTESAGLAVP
jgi:hypothetical protein